MMRFSRLAAAAALIVLFGAGCGGDTLFTASGSVDTNVSTQNVQGGANGSITQP